MTAAWTVIFTLFGISIGSFLNVCIDRLPRGGSLFAPPSHCDGCGRPLAFYENVPVISYLVLGGRCRTCGIRIPLRVFAVEGITGALFIVAFLRFDLTPVFGVTVFWSCVFIVIIFIDKEHQLILNKVTYPAAVVAVLLLAADTIWPGAGLLSNLRVLDHTALFPVNSIVSGLLGGFIFFTFFAVVMLVANWYFKRDALGAGDVKLVALIGLATAFPLAFVAVFSGIFIGGLAAIYLIIQRIAGSSKVSQVAYGMFLGIGPIITLLWGAQIFNWYIGLAS